jgi:hypothetical protein
MTPVERAEIADVRCLACGELLEPGDDADYCDACDDDMAEEDYADGDFDW